MKRMMIVFGILTCLATSAQQVVEVSGEYTYYAPATMSLEDAKQEAILQTRLHVLAAKFGTLISSTTTLMLQNNEGENSRSRSDVTTLATHEVKGEWLKDTREPEQEVLYDNSMPNTTIIRTRIRGKARSITEASIDVSAALVNSATNRFNQDVFADGDDLFLRFSSPVSGRLCVYLIDEEDNAFCLLPYQNNTSGYQPITANEDYTFFTTTTDPSADEYTLNTQYSQEKNAVYVIFSPNAFTKANDKKGGENRQGEQLPRQLSVSDFRNWLCKNQTKDPQMVVLPFLISIRKQ